MPVNILSAAERSRRSQFPEDISESDLIQYFTLTPEDLAQVNRKRQPDNRLGFSLQLCGLRYMGFCPEDLQQTPKAIATFVSGQLEVEADVLSTYGQRHQTRSQHFQQVQAYLGFRTPKPIDLKRLSKWLVNRALEHDKPSLLFQVAAEKLFRDKLVRPGVTVLERMVSTVRNRAMQETHKRLRPLLTLPVRRFLNQLLEHEPQIHGIRFSWLRRPATSNSPKAITRTINKIRFLRDNQVHLWDVSMLNPNRLKFLARLAKKSSVPGLKRMPIGKRYPLLIAFAHQLLIEATDEAVDLFIRCLSDTHARARNDLKAFRQREAVAINEKVRLLEQVGSVILDPQVDDPQVRADIFEQVTPEELAAAITDCNRLARPAQDESYDYFAARYSYIRQFAPAFLDTFSFQSNRDKDPLLEAITILHQLNMTGKRQVPDSAPMAFVGAPWKSYIRDEKGKIQRRYYEMCVLWELRHALRSGNLWVEGARRYADPESYLIPKEQWPSMRAEFCQMMSLPEQGEQRLEDLNRQLDTEITRFMGTLQHNPDVRVVDERIVLSPLEAQAQSKQHKHLKSLVNQSLPEVDLTDLLIEVDILTGFSDHLVHTGGHQTRSQETKRYLYAALLSQACNLGLKAMAKSADLSYERLLWHNNWFIEESTLTKANTTLVNYHHQLPLTRFWGGGTLSSSDGQRFPVAVKNTQAVALPKYFGYGKGVTFYTWLSDQFSQYGSKVIPSTRRDSTYVFDGIKDNETELKILEHTTDTTGFTEVIFSFFDVCGLQFSPRIRDLGKQVLYRFKTQLDLLLKPLFKGRIKPKRIVDDWDEMLRVAASLQYGYVTASLLMSKLSSFPEPNRLLQAFQEYGRLVKTIYILRYYNSLDHRRRINRQLNKGEAVQSLRGFLVVARQGELRQRYQEGLENQAGCLTLVTNAIVVWNTVYLQAVLDYIERQGYEVTEENRARLSPARYEHINPHGKIIFDIEKTQALKGLRPLRSIKRASDQ
ncbi:Tn3 family transposase [Acaryochloris sp. CCMEE 5410]|uniref:Tn3 family transposase n=1 Tax=Acaryochloris sp. CCMEE 5410 TaxID=310037 RepID=UPI0002483B5B|nr:Tn3 family transposase [Acaryochloris sp. CCMEE 5410]KAI9129999.1 Tn3 family transposase [Acaryochloris sp. CCMEE 5410]